MSDHVYKKIVGLGRTLAFGIVGSVLLIAGPLGAEQHPGWRDQSGRPAPDSDAMQSKNGFGGWLVVTPDRDWKEKWDTSPETIPRFTTSERVAKGQRLTILIFFVNPGIDADGAADITADLQSLRPDGSFSINEKDVVCYRGKVEGSPSNVRLSAPVIEYVGEEKDPVGRWEIRVKLKDNRRGISLPLRTTFTLQ